MEGVSVLVLEWEMNKSRGRERFATFFTARVAKFSSGGRNLSRPGAVTRELVTIVVHVDARDAGNCINRMSRTYVL